MEHGLKVAEAAPLSVIAEATTPDSDALFAAAMAAADAEPETPTEAVATPTEPEKPTEPVVAPPAETVKAAEPEKPATPPPQPELPPQVLKLMEREAQVVEREVKLKAAEADLTALRQHLGALEDAQRKFKYDPIGYIRKLAPDLDLKDLAKSAWYEGLGEGAPAEYRATREARAARSTVEELRTEFEGKLEAERNRWSEDIQRREAETAYHQYVGSLSTYAQSVPDEFPLVKSFAASNPDRVQSSLLQIAQRHAQATGGEVLTPAECAAALNKEFEGFRAALGLQATTPAATPPAPTAPTPATPASTLRNKHTSIQPSRGAEPVDEESKFFAALEAARAAAKASE